MLAFSLCSDGVLEGNWNEEYSGRELAQTGRGVWDTGAPPRDTSTAKESYTEEVGMQHLSNVCYRCSFKHSRNRNGIMRFWRLQHVQCTLTEVCIEKACCR